MSSPEENAHCFVHIFGFPPSFAEDPVKHPDQLSQAEEVQAQQLKIAEDVRWGRLPREALAEAVRIAAVCLVTPRMWNGDFPGWVHQRTDELLEEIASLDASLWLG